MSDSALNHREFNATASGALAVSAPEGRDGSFEIRLSAAEAPPPGGSAEIAVLESQVEELRSKSAELGTRNAEIEHRLTAATTELEALRHTESGETAELRQRIKTLTEHLDSADRHVASMRARLDQLTVESSRRITRLESRAREQEIEYGTETKRLKETLSTETGNLQKRIEELEDANQRLAGEARLATSAAARQRHALEGRVTSLLNDIEELKTRNADGMGDRDRVIGSLRQDIENAKSLAAAEKAGLRQNIADAETARQRELQQHAKLIDGLKTSGAGLAREVELAREAAAAERRRFEAALADERDRARHQINARDEQRRKIEARAEAAEKQAAGATAKATMEIARANQLEVRLNAERTARADEIDALTQRIAALSAEREAEQNSDNLVIDELRVRLAEAIGEEGATSAVSTARDRREGLLAELYTLRAKVAEHEASAAASPAVEKTEAVAENAARARIAEVLAYANSLEKEISEMRGRLDQPPEPVVELHRHDEQPSWRRVFTAKVANGRR